MEYFCGYCPKQRRKPDGASLLVQHCEYRQGQVLLACLCRPGKDANEMLELLFRWFRGLIIAPRDFRKADKAMGKWKRQLEDLLSMEGCVSPEFSAGIHVAGILCFGNRAILFCRGEMEILLIQEDIGRAKLRRVRVCPSRVSGWEMELASVQPNVGFLLTSQEFATHILDVKLNECLKMRNIVSEEQLQKQLEELVEVSADDDMGAACVIGVKIGGANCD